MIYLSSLTIDTCFKTVLLCVAPVAQHIIRNTYDILLSMCCTCCKRLYIYRRLQQVQHIERIPEELMQTTIIDDLEIEHGTAILSDLTGQHLTRNQQPVRLFDQTRHSSEYFFRSDQQGKPYIQNFAEGKRYYPVTAYCQAYGVDYATAKEDLCQQYGLINGFVSTTTRAKAERPPLPPPPPVDYIPLAYYQQCQCLFERNGLYEYLRFTYGRNAADEVFTRYHLGTSRRWQYLGYLATCLPQFDIAGNLRQVKVMAFDAMNGRRVKEHQQAQEWNSETMQYESMEADAVKSQIIGRFLPCYHKRKRPNLQQCFFGEHLLTAYPDQTVALAEGESTAIVCSLIWPDYTWLATVGSMGGRWFDPDRFAVLSGRKVVIWPDTDKHDDWTLKAEPLRSLVHSLTVSEYVKNNTPTGMSKVDLRDLLTRPCYFPTDRNQPVYGELLPVEPCDDYPPNWDGPSIKLSPIYNRPKLTNTTN